MCTPMFIAASLLTVSTWTQPNCPQMNGRMRKSSIYTTECDSAVQRMEILSFVTP